MDRAPSIKTATRKTRLGERASGRDNNLNLIRAIAACAVLVSHAWPIASGPGTIEPLYLLTGHKLGTLAVFVFFAISGFLIAASYQRSSSMTSFTAARALRLFPGLIVSLLVVALVIGPVVTTLPLTAYLTDPGLAKFVIQNTALVFPQFHLPGVFETNPYTDIEGSIWTLIHEVICYAGLFLIGVLQILKSRMRTSLALGLFFGACMAVPTFDIALPGRVAALLSLAVPFAVGVGFYSWQDEIPLSLTLACALAFLAWATHTTPAAAITLSLALAYATFWLAYIPGGAIRSFNQLGDYSYGIYIYAFPIQGLMVWAYGPQSPLANILLATPLTLALSVASWHLVEKPALDAKAWLVSKLSTKPAAQLQNA